MERLVSTSLTPFPAQNPDCDGLAAGSIKFKKLETVLYQVAGRRGTAGDRAGPVNVMAQCGVRS